MSASPDYSSAYLKEAWKVFMGCTGALGSRMLTVMGIIQAILCSYLVLVVEIVLEGAALDLIKPRIYHDLHTWDKIHGDAVYSQRSRCSHTPLLGWVSDR